MCISLHFPKDKGKVWLSRGHTHAQEHSFLSPNYDAGFVSKIQVFLKERRENILKREKELETFKKIKMGHCRHQHHKLKVYGAIQLKWITRTEMVVRIVSKRLILRKCIAYVLVTLSFKHQTEVTKTPGPHTLAFPK